MAKIIVVCTLAAAICAGRQAANSKMTAQSVLDEMKSKGTGAALREYTSGTARKWHSILKRVEGGEADWLSVANELRSASDASHSQDLDFSVATALAKNPAGVLRLKNFELEHVCDVPYLEPSKKVVRDFQAKAAAALTTVKDADLQVRRMKCQSILMAP